jgi:putative copper export protein
MQSLYLLSVTIHILTAALWVGGMGFFALVVVPAVRRSAPPEQARAVLRDAGMRFTRVGHASFAVLILTGLFNLHVRGVLSQLGTADFWRSPFGTTLALKLVFVALAFAASLIHGREANSAAPPDDAARRRSSMLGRAVLLFSIAAVVLAVFLVRGNPW